MARVDFYHLTRDPAATVLARLAERVLGAGDRLLIVAGEIAVREDIDAALWTALPESFLAHMPAGSPVADQVDEPVMLASSLDDALAIRPSIVALADGEWRDQALDFTRTLFLFDGSHIDDARAAWRTLSKREGVECHYWKQDSAGRWKEGP
jgi:DNA polymerase-3 subunit chi